MLPILIQFRFPDFLGHLGWIEIVVTLVVFGLVFLWRRRGQRFSFGGFFLWVSVYVVLRGLVWYAGPSYHFKLHTYGVLIAMGFVVGIYLAVSQAKRELVDPNVVLDLAFWILIAAMVGSRILFIIINIEEYVAEPINLIKIWQGGLVFYGGFIGAVAASWYYCYRKNISFLRISDLLIPSVAIGHFFGRLGCFSAGCCHGSKTGMEGFGAVFHSTGTVVARNNLLNTPLHPFQLYDAFGELVIFVLLVLLRKRKSYNGQLLGIWLVSYPAWRIITEMFRGDMERGVLASIDLFGDSLPEFLSSSQLVSLGLIALGGYLLFSRRVRALVPTIPRKGPTEAP